MGFLCGFIALLLPHPKQGSEPAHSVKNDAVTLPQPACGPGVALRPSSVYPTLCQTGLHLPVLVQRIQTRHLGARDDASPAPRFLIEAGCCHLGAMLIVVALVAASCSGVGAVPTPLVPAPQYPLYKLWPLC